MKTRLHGIDVSHHNAPNWERVAESSQFVICRATYGKTKDRKVLEHVAAAREHGLSFGLYHFFRPSVSIAAQLEAFGAVAESVGYGPGDIIPALDVELDPIPSKQAPSPEWLPALGQIVAELCECWGDCLVYLTQADHRLLGHPDWILERPLWVPHWTRAEAPATPAGRPWRLWQYAVGPYAPGERQAAPGAQGALDHNFALNPLPLIPDSGQAVAEAPVAKFEPSIWLDDEYWLDYQSARTAQVLADSEDT